LTDVGAPEPSASRRRSAWLSPGRIAATGLTLLILAIVIAWLVPANGYELLLVDPAHPVAPLVRISGHRVSHPPGSVYFVDVRERRAQLIERLVPWVRSDGSSLVRTPPISSALEQRIAQVDMTDSQKIAPYVALRLLGYRVKTRSSGVIVLDVQRSAPSAKVLSPNDIIVAVNGHAVPTVTELRALLSHKHPGDRVTIRFRHQGQTRLATVRTVSNPAEPGRALIGIDASDDLKVKLPFPVVISVPGVTGPSAGLAFALEILRQLGRNVTHGRKVAATGELAPDGRVLPIGGVKQKTLGARRAHVDVFLVPAGENAREARKYADGLQIVPVENIQQALRALATLAPEP
jgi:PDZ domain-containing protein